MKWNSSSRITTTLDMIQAIRIVHLKLLKKDGIYKWMKVTIMRNL